MLAINLSIVSSDAQAFDAEHAYFEYLRLVNKLKQAKEYREASPERLKIMIKNIESEYIVPQQSDCHAKTIWKIEANVVTAHSSRENLNPGDKIVIHTITERNTGICTGTLSDKYHYYPSISLGKTTTAHLVCQSIRCSLQENAYGFMDDNEYENLLYKYEELVRLNRKVLGQEEQ